MALEFNGTSSRVVYSNVGNLNAGAKSILLDFFLPGSAFQINNDFFSATRNSGQDTFQNFLLQLSDEGGTNNSVRAAHFGAVTGQAYTASDVLTVGQWNRIVWTCSDCSAPSVLNTKIYVNGVSQAIFGGSTGSNLGATNGDVCIGNRAHLDRGINGQIARFALVDRVADESEVSQFELGLPPDAIFSNNDFLLKPTTTYLSNWNSVIGGNTNTASLSNVNQALDPTYGLASTSTRLTSLRQTISVTNSTPSGQSVLSGQSSLSVPAQLLTSTVVPPVADVGVSGEFDGATLDAGASSVQLSGLDATVTLVPRKFPYRNAGNDWLTVQALVSGVNSVNSIEFRLSETDFDFDQKFTPETKLWWRPVLGSKEEWTLFDNNVLANGTLSASNNSSFSTPDIYVADQPGYYYGDVVNDIGEWLSSPFVTPTSGAETDGSISTLTSIEDENGRISGPLKQHALRIADDSVLVHPKIGAKLRILAFANVHSGEMVAKWAVKGFVDWLIGSSNEAADVRRNFEVFVVWVNSTGLFLGHPVGSEFTGTFAHKNLNRDWGDFDLEASRNVRNWITSDLNNELDFIIDFHNLTWSTDDRIFRDPTSVAIEFSDAVDARYSGNITQQENTAPSGFTTYYYKINHGIEGATLEPRRGSNSLSNYQQFGSAVGAALQDMLESGAFGRFTRSSTQLPYPGMFGRVSVVGFTTVRSVITAVW
ncbi:LamG-like jellyroll fold domain-containing protein [Denitrobaculum tricleocarpae]|uniref:Uncharacterized protein n=1 Tax=Denitrobaculum tricleocarpae TaxID=2591009 RepID=A0A545TUB4_9PROT|nr:LamG-like jellyroll fold domain-containing protein [Denitrobaculum tricleocarpae]TQV80802.1 hypothetical protein FKG95_11680 [Denitrobaculum tricleocarpae]